MTLTFKPATREASFARIALTGPSGAGKTYTALALATALPVRSQALPALALVSALTTSPVERWPT